MLAFFPLDVLDEIWDVIESVSGGFLTYSLITAYCNSKSLIRLTNVWRGINAYYFFQPNSGVNKMEQN